MFKFEYPSYFLLLALCSSFASAQPPGAVVNPKLLVQNRAFSTHETFESQDRQTLLIKRAGGIKEPNQDTWISIGDNEKQSTDRLSNFDIRAVNSNKSVVGCEKGADGSEDDKCRFVLKRGSGNDTVIDRRIPELSVFSFVEGDVILNQKDQVLWVQRTRLNEVPIQDHYQLLFFDGQSTTELFATGSSEYFDASTISLDQQGNIAATLKINTVEQLPDGSEGPTTVRIVHLLKKFNQAIATPDLSPDSEIVDILENNGSPYLLLLKSRKLSTIDFSGQANSLSPSLHDDRRIGSLLPNRKYLIVGSSDPRISPLGKKRVLIPSLSTPGKGGLSPFEGEQGILSCAIPNKKHFFVDAIIDVLPNRKFLASLGSTAMDLRSSVATIDISPIKLANFCTTITTKVNQSCARFSTQINISTR